MGLERLIVRHLPGISEPSPAAANSLQESEAIYGSAGYVLGRASDYNRDVALDVVQLLAFLQATQPKVVDTLELGTDPKADGIKHTQFLHRLQGEITKRGVVDVLRKGVSHGPVHIDLYKLLPTTGNTAAADAFGKNIFSVTRQVRYSNSTGNDGGNELDLVVFINGLPVLTFKLKNSLTKQTLADAIVQYQSKLASSTCTCTACASNWKGMSFQTSGGEPLRDAVENHAGTSGSPIRRRANADGGHMARRHRGNQRRGFRRRGKPRSRRCSAQSRGGRSWRPCSVCRFRGRGWRPSKIASTMSGASMVMRSTSAAQPSSCSARVWTVPSRATQSEGQGQAGVCCTARGLQRARVHAATRGAVRDAVRGNGKGGRHYVISPPDAPRLAPTSRA